MSRRLSFQRCHCPWSHCSFEGCSASWKRKKNTWCGVVCGILVFLCGFCFRFFFNFHHGESPLKRRLENILCSTTLSKPTLSKRVFWQGMGFDDCCASYAISPGNGLSCFFCPSVGQCSPQLSMVPVPKIDAKKRRWLVSGGYIHVWNILYP